MANTYIYDLSARWTNGSTTYNGFKLNIVDTASAANSNIIHLLYNSNTFFRVKKDGTVFTKSVSVTGNTTVNGSLSFTNTTAAGVILNALSNTQANSLSSPAQGSLIYNTTSNTVQVHNGNNFANVATVITMTADDGEAIYNNAGNFDGVTGILLSSGILKKFDITQGTITVANAMIDGTVTWNNTSATFTAWKLNLTDTSSSASSLLLDLQVASTSKFKVAKDGSITTTGSIVAAGTTTISPTANTSALVVSGYSLTGSNTAALMSLSGTWNTTGAPSALVVDITDTASNTLSSYIDVRLGGTKDFVIGKNSTSVGMWFKQGTITNSNYNILVTASQDSITLNAAQSVMFQTGGQNYGNIRSSRFLIHNGLYFGFSSDLNGTGSTRLYEDASNTLAQRNSTNAQTTRFYNTFTDSSNGEWLEFGFSSNVPYIRSAKIGTGTSRALNFGISGTDYWQINTSGNLMPLAQLTREIGDGTATVNVIWSKTIKNSNGDTTIETQGSGSSILNGGNSLVGIRNTGVFWLAGTTSSFPGLKRDGVGISARLADDSAGTWMKVLRTTVTSLPSASTSGAGAFAIVSDANSPTLGATVSGGGSTQVFVISDGTNWKVA